MIFNSKVSILTNSTIAAMYKCNDYEAVYIIMHQSQWIGNFLHHILNLVFHIKCVKWTISTTIRLSKYDHYDCLPWVKTWSYLCDILAKIIGIVNSSGLSLFQTVLP